jgi:hypothetical protein
MRGRRKDLNLEAYSESLYPERLGWSPLRALRHGRYKVIDAPRRELYDLERDPFEEQNIYDERQPLARQMAARAAGLAGAGPGRREGQTGVTPELREGLAALGYISSTAAGEVRNPTALPDPKDCIASHPPDQDSMARVAVPCQVKSGKFKVESK